MNHSKKIILGSIGLSGLMIFGSLFCFPTLSTARIIRSDALTIQLEQKEVQDINIDSNILTESGQIIVLNHDLSEVIIPITVSAELAENNQAISGTVYAVSSDEEKMTVSLDSNNVTIDQNINIINLSIKIKELLVPDIQPEQGTLSGNQIAVGTLSGNTIETHLKTLSGNEINEKTQEKEETLSAQVILNTGEKEYSATFIVIDNEQKDKITKGNIDFCPSQFHPSQKTIIKNGQEADCRITGFPGLTRYKMDNQSYMLYQDGSMILPAGKEAEFDFSKTDLKTDLEITTDSGKSYVMKYTELPQISEDMYPLILGKETLTLPFEKKWGDLDAIIIIEQLEIIEEVPVWKAVNSITAVTDEEKNLKLTSNQAEAGTYRIKVLWMENEETLYSTEIPFFIQYQTIEQEVKGNDQ